MQPNEIIEVLNRPISQELPAHDVTHLAYVAKDGTRAMYRSPSPGRVASEAPNALIRGRAGRIVRSSRLQKGHHMPW